MLAHLINVPKNDAEWDEFGFHHRDSHDKIRAAIQSRFGVRLANYEIYPLFEKDLQGWLQRHAQLHIEMTGVLNQQSQDLQDVDLTNERQLAAWTSINYKAHLDAEMALGI